MLSTTRLRIAAVTLLCCVLALAVHPGATSGSGWKRVIIKCDPADLDQIKQALGAAVVDASHGRYLLNVKSDTDLKAIAAITGHSPIVSDDDRPVHLRRGNTRMGLPGSAGPSKLDLGGWTNYYGAPAPRIYTDQPAVTQIDLKDALEVANGRGVRVAVIDTGIDFRNPLFPPGTILPGRNYVGRSGVPSEYDDPILSQSTLDLITLEQSTIDIIALEQSTLDLITLEQSNIEILSSLGARVDWRHLSAAAPVFGHGTMSAGLVHLVAPRAQIIPLKAFDANGASSEWMIVQAILDAVDMGADIINMSFASTRNSQFLEEAVRYAASQGVVLVAAAGNENTEALTYPASLSAVIGVAAVNANDVKASFSNYGGYVDISGPGVDLITPFPGGLARVSGTSESTPVISGIFALAIDNGTRSWQLRDRVLKSVEPILDPPFKGKLGAGRISAAKAVSSGRDQR